MRYMFPRYPNGVNKAVTLSYDDASCHDIRLADTLTKYNLKCTFNVNAAYLDGKSDDWHLAVPELKEHMSNVGHEIAVHGYAHRANGKQRAIEGIKDVLDCRIALEKSFGGIIRGMAYPDSGIRQMMNGASYETIRQYLQNLDIVYARTAGGDNDRFELPEDWYSWTPTAHHDNPALFDYIDAFFATDPDNSYCARTYPRLLYIWGHAFEFDQKGNWERLEEICRRISGRDDVWYATNIEIYNYIKAYDALVFNAAGDLAYNPSLIPVWFSVDGVTLCVNPGETVSLPE